MIKHLRFAKDTQNEYCRDSCRPFYFLIDQILRFGEMGIFLPIFVSDCDNKFISVHSFKNEDELKHFTINTGNIIWG